MLQSIRKGARSWLGIVLAFILIPPFAIVGVEYIFRDGFSRAEAVITVGEQEVLGREYEGLLRRQMDELRRRTGRPIDYKTAKSFGVVDLVANSLVAQALYRQATQDQGILIGDAVVRQAVRNIDAFKGVDGRFDPARYEAALQNAQISEQQFLESQRGTIASQYLMQSISRIEAAPNAMVDAVDRFRNEKRTAYFFTIRASTVTDLPKPTDKQLEARHAKHKDRYTQATNRAVSVIHVAPQDVFGRIKVSDTDIQATYAKDKAKYTKAETRTLRQLLFAKEEEAKKAYAAMVGGKTFDAVAKDIVKPPPLSLGTVKAGDLPVPELAKAAFAKKESEVTEPVKTSLGWHIVSVDKVNPEKVIPLKDVKAGIEKAIKLKRSGKILDPLREDADDGLGADLTLAKIAAQLKMKVRVIPAIDVRGRDANGKAIKNLPQDGRFLQRAFQQKPGRDYREVVELKDGAFFIVQVDKVTPSRLIPLQDVKDKVTRDWRKAARLKALKVKADALAKKIKDGKSIKDVAEEAKLSLKSSSSLNRYGATGASGVSSALRDALFKAEKKGAVVAQPGVGGYSVAVLTDIKIEGDAKKQRQTIVDTLKRSIGQELLSQYDAMLRKTYPVTINRKGIDQLFSRQGQQQQASY